MNGSQEKENKAQRLTNELANASNRKFAWFGPGMNIVLFRLWDIAESVWKVLGLYVRMRQWLRLALTLGWIGGIVESFRILDAATSGPFWRIILFIAASFGFTWAGLWMNQSAFREINGLPPRVDGGEGG